MKNKIIGLLIMVVMLVVFIGCAPGSGIQVTTPIPDAQSGTPAPGGQIDVPGFKIQLNTPGVNPLANKAGSNGHVAGLLTGIWHGIIAPVTLVLSFINPNFQMYEVHNDGSQYNLGFLVGVALVFLILGLTAGRGRRR
jgi:hypothetical protein